MTKEEILAKHGDGQLYNGGAVVDGYIDSIIDAMSEYAEQQSIEFCEWMSRHELDFQPANGGKWIGINMVIYSVSELFTLYKQSI